MAEISYTHDYDGCFRIAAFLGGAFVALFPAATCDFLIMKVLGYDSVIRYVVSVPVFFVCWCGLIVLVIWCWGHIPDYLYLRLSLGVPISLKESKHYRFLLSPDENGGWFPLTKIKSLPKNQRKQFLRSAACAVLEERKKSKEV